MRKSQFPNFDRYFSTFSHLLLPLFLFTSVCSAPSVIPSIQVDLLSMLFISHCADLTFADLHWTRQTMLSCAIPCSALSILVITGLLVCSPLHSLAPSIALPPSPLPPRSLHTRVRIGSSSLVEQFPCPPRPHNNANGVY
jgi:hypothetical protein